MKLYKLFNSFIVVLISLLFSAQSCFAFDLSLISIPADCHLSLVAKAPRDKFPRFLLSQENSGVIYNPANRITNHGFSYDDNGNLLTKPGGYTFTYDYENRLITVNSPQSTVNYSYDGLGRRVQKNINGAKTRYVYDNEDIAFEYNGNNQIQASYVHGAGIDEPLSMTRGADTYYYLTDGLGSITQLINSSGTVVKSYTYDSFGNILSETGTLANPYAFTAREWDPETELYFYRARTYDPFLGRFLQEDPILGRLKLPQSLNKYPYVENNPVNHLDPYGMSELIAKLIGEALAKGINKGTSVSIGKMMGAAAAGNLCKPDYCLGNCAGLMDEIYDLVPWTLWDDILSECIDECRKIVGGR